MATGPYEELIDTLQQYLIDNVNTSSIGDGGQISWTIGDVGQAQPEKLPAGFLVPFFDNPEPYSAGVDKDTYLVPLLVVVNLHQYGPAIANTNVAGGFEQPGYRVLMQYAEAVRTALRDGGQGITLDGLLASSSVPVVQFVWVSIDNTPYRAARLAFQAQRRVPWEST